jgi:hypothetical protein
MPAQVEVVNARTRFNFLAAGRRWGKTFAAKCRIVKVCTEVPCKYAYVTPTYAGSHDVWSEIAFDEGLAPYIRNTKLQPYPQIFWQNGSLAMFRSFERPRNLRGKGLREIWIDEIQDIPEEDFWKVLRPCIADVNEYTGERGTLWCSGQFRGENWYYKQLYLPGLDTTQAVYRSWRFPSSTGYQFRGPGGRAELELMRRQMTRMEYEEECECLPIANSSAVFRPEDLRACTQGQWRTQPEPGVRYVAAIDIAQVADRTGIVVLDTAKNTVVYSELRPLKERYEVQAPIVAQIVQRFGALPVLDSTGGATGGNKPGQPDVYLEMFRKYIPGLRPFYFVGGTKINVVKHLSLEIEQHKLQIPQENKELLEQLGMYEFEYRNGRYDYHGPKRATDDLVAALGMAAWTRKVNMPPAGLVPLGVAL